MKYITINSLNNPEYPFFRKVCYKFSKRYVVSYAINPPEKIRGSVDMYAEFDDDTAEILLNNFKRISVIENILDPYNLDLNNIKSISAKELMDNYEKGNKRKYWIDEFYSNL